MRKRRRLADKFTIMVCAVLVAVSAFFYAPMDVSASSFDSVTEFNNTVGVVDGGASTFLRTSKSTNLSELSVLDSSKYYKVYYSGNYSINLSTPFAITQLELLLSGLNNSLYIKPLIVGHQFYAVSDTFNFDFSGSFILEPDVRSGFRYNMGISFIYGDGSSLDVNSIISMNIDSVEVLTGEESSSYQQGYNAGYSAGEQAGESNGYSNGYSDGFEAGEQSGYDSGFEAGKESVDTQSYYDLGYSAGYDAGYLSGYDVGYDDGYDDGWQAYEDKISGWGADTSDYPLLVFDSPLKSKTHSIIVKSSIPTRYFSFDTWTLDYDFNSNHTYRFDVTLTPTQYKEGSADIYFMEYKEFYFNIGGIKYHLSNFSGADVNQFFVPGDRISNAYSFSWEPLLAVMGDTFESGSASCSFDLSYQIYDMGPSGDTQNHIANQTDQLTGGYNDSQGNSVNNDFSTGLNEFETAEDSLFATATTGLKDFTFFDIQSVPAMVTGMSFVGSIMSGWFSQAGGASGVGIVLSILFSIMLVAMVLGLYRWYQSKGGKD